MGKTLIYLVLLAILGFAVYYFVFSEHEVFGKKEAAFQIKDTGAIGRIFIADKNGSSVTLERKENGWVMDGQFSVTSGPLNTLLQTMATQTPVYPVPKSMHDNVVAMMAARAVKVELYERDGDKLREFYVGGQAPGKSGTYMLMEGAARPYVVQIPGLEGYVATRYSADASVWRSKQIASISEEDLKTVTVSYPDEPLNSFTLNRTKDGKLSVSLDEELKGLQFNERRAKIYSGYFESLYAEGYINGTIGLDSVIANTLKRCTVDMESHSGQKQHMEVYWMALNKRSKNRTTPNPNTAEAFDADRFYATINDFKDTVIIQRQMFEKIFRKGYEFYQGDDTTKKPGSDIHVNDLKTGSIKIGQ